jgi:ubiquinone/menaquinone biosynthesis C-methylase UbiE
MAQYKNIQVGGADTASPLTLSKRVNFILRFLPDKDNATILDCGCGKGDYVDALRQHGIEAYGIEYSEEKVVQAGASHKSAEYIRQGDAQDMQFPDCTFDAVLLNEVLEHIPDEHKALSEINRVLKDSGTLIIFSPNRWYPFETHSVQLKHDRKLLPIYVPFIPYIPTGIGERLFNYRARNYWHSQLKALVESQGFEVLHQEFIWQTFENITGTQPLLLQKTSAFLRRISNILEKTPLLKRFGISQVIIARKKCL